MRSRRRGLKRAIAIAILAAAAVFTTTSSASALDEPRVPQNVGQYFATALIPRLADLFGGKAGAEVVFDATAKVGDIHRVLSFTTRFLSGAKTADPTQITNTWIAPVSAGDGTVAGVATVWINPASEQPELADFSSGTTLATALGAAPQGTLLIRDDAHSAWFATDGTTLIPLVSGTSGVAAPTTLSAYQQKFTLAAPAAATASPNRGLLIAVGVLGIVVVLLAVFVVLPDRRRRAGSRGAAPESEVGAAPTAMTETVPDAVEVKPVTVKPATAKPATVKPATVKPATVKPATAKPVTVKPATAKPVTVKPVTVKPATAKPVTAKPATAKPVTVKPATAKPATAKPGSPKRPPAPGVSS